MSEALEASTTTSVEKVIRITTQTYDRKAEEYAITTGDYASYPGLESEVLSFADMTPAGLPLLDLGCGPGRDAHRMAVLGRRVIAGDISVSMLRCARRNAAAGGTPRLPYTAFDAMLLPFRPGTIGGVWASGCLLHLPSAAIPRALSEILRVLAPGGVAAISMQAGTGEGWRDGGTLSGQRWFTFVQPERFSSAMSCSGFVDVRVHSTGRHNWFIAWGRATS